MLIIGLEFVSPWLPHIGVLVVALEFSERSEVLEDGVGGGDGGEADSFVGYHHNRSLQ